MTNASIGTGEGTVTPRTDAWNIADGYTKIKILRPLINLDRYEDIANFGKQEMEDAIDPKEIPYKRVEAFERLLFALKQVVGNCKFSIEIEDKNLLDKLLERIENVEKVMDGLATLKKDYIKNEDYLEINEEHFRNCFGVLRSVKDELMFLLNRAGLIFKQTEEVDIEDMLGQIEMGG